MKGRKEQKMSQHPNSDEESAATPPANLLLVSDLETLKVVADPLRQQILRELRAEPLPVKRIAQMLSVEENHVYYAIRQLEARQLVRVAGTRVVNGITEKHYQATALRLSVDPALLNQPMPED